jgi:transposase-like protein
MPKGHPSVSKEVKDQILKRIKDDGISVSQVASEHGLSTKTIYGWLGKGVIAPPSVLEVAKLKRENQALKALIGQIMLDLELEKKKMDGKGTI